MRWRPQKAIFTVLRLGLLATIAGAVAAQDQGTPTTPPDAQAATPAPSVAGVTWSEDFEPPTLEGWELVRPGAKLVPGPTGLMLAPDCPSQGLWVAVNAGDLALDFDFLNGTGGAWVILRGAGEGDQFSCYRLVFAASQEIGLLRTSLGQEQGIAGQPLTLAPDTWYQVSVQMTGGSIRVMVDGTQVLDVVDPQPLGPGRVEFGCMEGSGFGFDNIRITSPDLPATPPPSPGIPIDVPDATTPSP